MGMLSFDREHPVNGAAIIEAARASGCHEGNLLPSDLFSYDQDNFGGVHAVASLLSGVRLGEGFQVLDVCSGVGGAARYLASQHGCRVTGIDLSIDRVRAASDLTAAVELSEKVTFVCGTAVSLPFGDETFDCCICQDSLLHISKKRAVYAEMRRVLKTSGHLYVLDVVEMKRLSRREREWLLAEFSIPPLCTAVEHRRMATEGGFSTVETTDLSKTWRDALSRRLHVMKLLLLQREVIGQLSEEQFDRCIRSMDWFGQLLSSKKIGMIKLKAQR